jgi:hypothetical protein
MNLIVDSSWGGWGVTVYLYLLKLYSDKTDLFIAFGYLNFRNTSLMRKTRTGCSLFSKLFRNLVQNVHFHQPSLN